MIVVGFYTDARYRRYAERMARSAEGFGLATKLYEKPDTGSWQRNVHHKPAVIFRALVEHQGQDVLYVDADALFRSFPSVVRECPKDMAVTFDEFRPVSGTVFVRNRPGGWEIVQAWLAESLRVQDQHDDVVNLAAVVERLGKTRVWHLPQTYYWIARSMRPRFPTAVPVIEHFNVGEHTFPNPEKR